jgi:hypothetical protein
MRPSILASLALLTSCATTLTAAVTTPSLDSSARGLPSLPTRSVLVVSAATFLQVSPDLVFNPCLSSTAAGSRAYGAGCPPAPLAELASATALIERALFEAGWEPVTQAAAARVITSSRVAVGLRSLLSRGQASLLEGTLVVGPATSADLLLVVSDWWTSFDGAGQQGPGTAKLCPLSGVLGLEAYGRTGALLWRGQVTVQTTDLRPVSRTGSEVSPAGFACVATQSCAECTSSQQVSPAAVQALLSHATTTLLGSVLTSPLTR